MDSYLSALVYSKDSVHIASLLAGGGFQGKSRWRTLCAGKHEVLLSGWGQRSGFLHKNTNATPKIQKILLLTLKIMILLYFLLFKS